MTFKKEAQAETLSHLETDSARLSVSRCVRPFFWMADRVKLGDLDEADLKNSDEGVGVTSRSVVLFKKQQRVLETGGIPNCLRKNLWSVRQGEIPLAYQ